MPFCAKIILTNQDNINEINTESNNVNKTLGNNLFAKYVTQRATVLIKQ